MYLPINKKTLTLTVDKSKFICVACPINNDDEANQIITEIKKEYPKARHYVYAYKINKRIHSNDDNEVNNIAKNFINLIEKLELTNVMLIVVRYFGGIKLGASRLLRTYLSIAKDTLLELDLGELKKVFIYKIKTDYSTFNRIKNLNSKIENIEFLDKVSFTLYSENDFDDYLLKLDNLEFKKENKEVLVKR